MANLMSDLMDNPLLHLGMGVMNANRPYIRPLGAELPATGLGAGLMQGMGSYQQHQQQRAQQDYQKAAMQVKMYEFQQAQAEAQRQAQEREAQRVTRERAAALMSPGSRVGFGGAPPIELPPDMQGAWLAALRGGNSKLATEIRAMMDSQAGPTPTSFERNFTAYQNATPQVRAAMERFKQSGASNVTVSGSGKASDLWANAPLANKASGWTNDAGDQPSPDMTGAGAWGAGYRPASAAEIKKAQEAVLRTSIDETMTGPAAISVRENFKRLPPQTQYGLGQVSAEGVNADLELGLNALAAALAKRVNPSAEPSPQTIVRIRESFPDYGGAIDYPLFLERISRMLQTYGLDPTTFGYDPVPKADEPPPPPGATVDPG